MKDEKLILPVCGQSAFTAIPSALYSSAIPSTHMDMPYFAIVYAVNTTKYNDASPMEVNIEQAQERYAHSHPEGFR